jgi:predicted amino acid dehydrogenase
VADYANVNLEKSTAAIVGAGGNIGSVTASLLSEDVPHLILLGSQKAQSIDKLKATAYSIYSDTVDVLRSTQPKNLKGLAKALAQDLIVPFLPLYGREYIFQEKAITEYIETKYTGKDREVGRLIKSIFCPRSVPDIGKNIYDALQIKHGKDPYITLGTDLKKYLADADIVVSAVSSDRTIMEAEWFKPGAIVNDVSLPTSVSDKIYKERPDVIAFEGGVGHLPEYIDLGIPGLMPGATLGCVAETFMCTMVNMIENYSFGPITKKQVLKIWEIGNMLGFGLGGVKYMGDKKLTRKIAAEIMRKSAK